ncbi:GNAT family N-acetyltransferase [Microlunatus speluncae]|uniref:GNAT family N-acetyltransferase n=1 Tax=Microlunatus speluncae TaxID=2594267 RepID=UPI0012664BED|nr:GNAT family N-acetyltransferase [Microlunatus speluncae]
MRPDDDPINRLLTDAFLDDPLMRWLFPDPATRPAALTTVLRLFLRSGQVRTTGPDEEPLAAAVWSTPAEHDLPAPAEPAPVLVPHLARLADLDRLLGERYPVEVDHRYLRVIGVQPAERGRGHGGTLLRQGLAEWDSAGLPIYLEASSSRNAALYARHGFLAYGEPARLPDGPELHPMWRDPRPPTDH